MVEKLGFKTKKHLYPYKLSWLLKMSEIKEAKRCLVSFSIGQNYINEILCDVVPMDSCHMIFRCPQQYDRKTINDGYKNTYSFVKNKVKIVLGPCKLENALKLSRREGNNLLIETKCKKKLKKEKKVA